MQNVMADFNGERRVPMSGQYHLGNGYRTYSPVLRRFLSPDSWSPFRVGGISPYAYCAGDPLTRADPSGHHSSWGWLGICAGVALGALLTPISGGSSLAVALSAVSEATAVVSTGLAVAQQFVEKTDPKAGAILGWAALGAGIVSGMSSAGLSLAAPGAKSLISLLESTRNDAATLGSCGREISASLYMDEISSTNLSFSSVKQIRNRGEFLGSGAYGEAWKIDNRVYKIYRQRPASIQVYQEEMVNKRGVMHSVYEWNYFYNMAYGGRFNEYANASALTVGDSKILSTPYIGEAVKTNSWKNSHEYIELNNELTSMNRELQDNNITNIRILDGKPVIIDFDLFVYKNNRAQNLMLCRYGFYG